MKIGDNRWIIEVRGTNGTEEQILDLPSGSIDQAGWDPLQESITDHAAAVGHVTWQET